MDYLSIVLTHVLESHVPGLPGLGQDVGGGQAPAVGHQCSTVVHRHLRLQALLPPRMDPHSFELLDPDPDPGGQKMTHKYRKK